MTQARICVVAYAFDQPPDAALADAVKWLRGAGLRPRGLLQEGEAGRTSCRPSLFLNDIGTGRRIQIFERRGVSARGCRLDSSGLAEAAGWLRDAIETRPDVLFINRFGRRESEGKGLLDEIGAAVAADIPIVIAIGAALLPAWRAFAGEEGTALAADPRQIGSWCAEQVRAPCA